MNIDKAIGNLELLHHKSEGLLYTEEREAIKLVGAALRQILKDRFMAHPYCLNPLPGATKD